MRGAHSVVLNQWPLPIDAAIAALAEEVEGAATGKTVCECVSNARSMLWRGGAREYECASAMIYGVPTMRITRSKGRGD